jgi:hypothetical protein
VLPEKLIIIHLVKKFSSFLVLESLFVDRNKVVNLALSQTYSIHNLTDYF